MYGDRESALAARRGNVVLAHCADCDLIHNSAFDPSLVEYAPGYENARNYTADLAGSWIERHRLHDKTIVEIGCGDGYFLQLLSADGANRCFGFDPAATKPATECSGVTIVREEFSIDALDGPVDCVVMRHVLEHVSQPRVFLTELRQALDEQDAARLLIEVPNTSQLLSALSIWEVIYDHYTYYTGYSLRGLLARSGFKVIRATTRLAGQFITAEARPASRDSAAQLGREGELLTRKRLREFAAARDGLVDYWKSRLAAWHHAGRRVLVWGAGAKGVMFMNTVDTCHNVAAAVDINPDKAGRFVAGTGHEVLAPRDIVVAPPDIVLLTNEVYEAEIRDALGVLGLHPQVLPVSHAS